jgi:hypothetical protein
VLPRGIWRYNARMPAAGTKRQPEKPSPGRPPATHIYAMETTGLLVIAALILILTLARYWQFIHWSLR